MGTDRWEQILDPACEALQRLDKKFRSLRNKGQATEAEVASIKAARALIAGLYKARGLWPLDIDSRAERGMS